VRRHRRSRDFCSEKGSTMFAIKADVRDPGAEAFAFNQQKTMYGGKHIARGDTIFVFASENEGGPGLIASGIVTSAEAIPKKVGIARQTPRVSITIRRTELAKRRLGRSELRRFSDWDDGRQGPDLNLKSYRKATNKFGGISDEAPASLGGFFQRGQLRNDSARTPFVRSAAYPRFRADRHKRPSRAWGSPERSF